METERSIIVALLQNIAILLAFSMLYDYFWSRYEKPKSLLLKIPTGIILGSFALIIMMTPWKMVPGIIFDVRSVLLAVAGLFFGFIPTVIAMIFALIYRISIGGSGVWMGTAVIISSGSIGILWRFFRPKWQSGKVTLELLALGYLVHFIMLASTALLPDDSASKTLNVIYIPVLTLYPAATLALGLLMIHWSNTWKNKKKLLESESQFKSLFEVAADAIFIADIDTGIILDANASASRLLAKPIEKIIGLHQSELHPPSVEEYSKQTFVQHVKEPSRETTALPLENRVVRSDGTEIPVEIMASNVQFKGKSCLMGIFRDITERKRNEETIRKNEERFRLMVKNSSDVIVVINADGTQRYVSPAIEMIAGYTSEESTGKTIAQVIHPDDLERVMEVWNIAIEHPDTVFSAEYRHIHKTKGWVQLEAIGQCFFDDPNVNAVIVSVRDITERKKTELLHRIQYNIAHAVVTSKNQLELFDVVKRELHELIDTSNFFIAFYDENTQTLKNALWADEKDHFDQWPVQNSLSGIVVTEGKPLMLTKSQIFDLAEKRNIKLLGTVAEYWVGFPLKLREKVIGAMVVQSYFARDHIEKFSIEVMEIVANQISLYIEKLRDEEQLIISKNKAEESDRLKSAFLANMSHEIRTPMNGILGFLGLLSESNLEEESKREYIEIINKSGHRLLETINDILEISQIEAGETKMVYSDVNIEDTMQFIFDFFRQQAVEKEITMEIANQVTGREALVKTDEHKLTGILTNLVKNAIKFTEHGKIELGNYLENKELIFYVKDTGIGIPTDKIDAIFEHFVQADMNLTRSHEGSGLGLSIVKAYIHALGGNIRVNSEIDKGSTFTFSIPYNRTEMNPPRETNAPNNLNELNRKITILIAEDDAASFQFLKALLIKEDIDLIRTKNGTETVSAVKENPDISLILMDIKMAGMDGFEATRQIRHFNKKIPIIAQTAYAFPADKEKAKEAGCNDYISKPINRVILFEMINKYTSDPTPLR